MRHAEAADTDVAHPTDASRPLTERGRADAEAAGRWLVAEGHAPARVVASPAARARESAALVAASAGVDVRAVEEDERLYGAEASRLARLVDEHARAGTTLVVAHNPAVALLRHALPAPGAGADGPPGFPPGSLVVLDLPDGPPLLGRCARLALRLA